MTKLVIVESPGKIKKIKSFLGPEYNVMASIGHIRGLAPGSNSVDPNDNFKPTYEIIHDKKKVVAGLKKATKDAKEIIIASDGDREGEAIAYHLVTTLGLDDYDRIVFHEITKNAITKALSEPRKVDMNMFNSQQARCILDWLIGFKVSPILKVVPGIITKSLGAGRVQSVVTRLIVDKETEINDFINSDKSSTYNITGDFTINGFEFKGTYVYNKLIDDKIELPAINNHVDASKINSYKMVKSKVDSKDQIKIIIINIRNDSQFYIADTRNSERFRHPPQPFITSTLQQEASYKLHFQLKKTMTLAQHLYEKGLITYMRTDSPTLSNEALNYIKKQILEDPALGEGYYQYRQFKAKGQNAQEAHEAIRPTHINVYGLNELKGTDEEKLYQLIWNRSVASQMKSAKYQDQHITLSNSKNVRFEGTNSILVFDGYLKLYRENEDDEAVETSHIKLNDQKYKLNNVTWSKIYFKETYSSPPTRYNEPSLVKKLENLGIGRPSTYAYIITKIQEHKYVHFCNNQGIDKRVTTYILTYIDGKTPATLSKTSHIQKIGNDKQKLQPTNDGVLITNYLIKNFPEMMDYKFTADMENQLDEIAEGNKIWHNVLDNYYSIMREQFKKLNLDIDKSYYKIPINCPETDKEKNKIIQPVKQIVGKHPKYGDITYMEAKFGPVFCVNLSGKSKNTLFVNAGKIKPSDDDVEDTAIKYIDYKLQRTITGKKKTYNKKK